MSTLLIVIDLQKGWRHKEATEPAMLKTVDLCVKFPGDVIHCCFKNDPSSLFHSQLDWTRFTKPEDTDEIGEIKKLKLPKYWRSTYSCLTPEVISLMQKYSKVYIAGVFTDISVTVTAMGVFDLGIPVTVVEDCVATLHGNDVHHAALKALDSALGKQGLVMSTSLS